MELFKFWNWTKDETGTRTLRIDGVIAEESWWGDEVTPALFLQELQAGSGDITVWLNSPGGDCLAASRIYTMLMDYKGNVTIKIDGMAYSAASVIAMAGTNVLMSPTALMMIHNPMTWAVGDSEEMMRASAMLNEVKETIINAYQIKTGMARNKLSRLMDAESFFPVQKAIEMGFVDGMLTDEKTPNKHGVENYIFSRQAVNNTLMNKVLASVRKQRATEPQAPPPQAPQGVTIESLEKRLSLIPNR